MKVPNWVYQKIEIECDESMARHIASKICPGKKLTFATFIPPPIWMYQGGLTGIDRQDFNCNWLDWSREHWGTKWDAHKSRVTAGGGKVVIQFETAWSVPYPWIAAVANCVNPPKMKHWYLDEGLNFWGIEEWEGNERKSKEYKTPYDLIPLQKMFGRYFPEDAEPAQEGGE